MLNKFIGVVAGVALVVSLLSLTRKPVTQVVYQPGQDKENLGVFQQTEVFPNGLQNGDEIVIWKSGLISTRANQGSWYNNTGRTVYADKAGITWSSGTASSSWAYYVATSSTATFSNDFARPSVSFSLIDGALTATSAPAFTTITSTTTTNGQSQGELVIRDGQYLVFQIQERFGCKTVGACETATSTNRGVSDFRWWVRLHYQK